MKLLIRVIKRESIYIFFGGVRHLLLVYFFGNKINKCARRTDLRVKRIIFGAVVNLMNLNDRYADIIIGDVKVPRLSSPNY